MTNCDIFASLRFKGTFRNYQQQVLDRMDVHLVDGKVHVVAAPGSGKTVLGLEMIRRVGKPALIFSPSITIRQQWQERFESMFELDGNVPEGLFSCDIRHLGLITSVTYQALHAAVTRQIEQAKIEESDDEEVAEILDFQDFDLLSEIHKSGIGTICLDEAHHLRTEWHHALETLIAQVGKEMTIISLTATPPYDSNRTEWDRYESLCGPIDEEIFVPQLVAQGTLCPHQDYIYFNYPTVQECRLLAEFSVKAENAIERIIKDSRFSALVYAPLWTNDEFLFDHIKGSIALLCCLEKAGNTIDTLLINKLTARKKLPRFERQFAELAFQMILDFPDGFDPEVIAFVRHELAASGLLIRRQVSLCTTKQLGKMLASSLGKLESISAIVSEEYGQQRDAMRMLILTDFIKSDTKRIIGTDQEIGEIGTVTIFETIRRKGLHGLRIAVLSGGLTIVPQGALAILRTRANELGVSFTEKIFPNTDYCELIFAASNKHKVTLITDAFQSGLFQIVIGTKSLLGEGWDSPCINTLILASFVGSFMLSNQMRGRAIRVDANQPNKTANIWHLVTIDPSLEQANRDDGNAEIINSSDFLVCKRKFEAFLAPAYSSDEITSGIGRCDIIQPPFTEAGFKQINQRMFELAHNREAMCKSWNGVLHSRRNIEITEAVGVPKPQEPSWTLYQNFFIFGAVLFVIGVITSFSALSGNISLSYLFYYLATLPGCGLIYWLTKKLVPRKKVKIILNSLLATMQATGDIVSRYPKIDVRSYTDNISFICELIDATQHEKAIFATAMTEMFQPIDNPRYLLISTDYANKRSYADSYACPSIISNKKRNVEIFVNELKKSGLRYEVVYTRNEAGRLELLQCRMNSFRNRQEFIVFGKKRLRREWE